MQKSFDAHWYNDPLTVCPICGKKFSPAVEHYWKIGSDSSYDCALETRNIPVCIYTCMRKWEKAQEGKSSSVKQPVYSEEKIRKLSDEITDPINQEILSLYFWDRLTQRETALKIRIGVKAVAQRVGKLKTLLDNMED